MNTKVKGGITEGVVMSAFIKAGKTVLIPLGENQRYDMVVDCGDRLLKVQCKTGRLYKGSLAFSTCSTCYRSGGDYKKKTYYGDVDIFAVYSPDLDKVYLIPVNECATTETRLRVSPSRSKNITKFAEEYEFWRVAREVMGHVANV